MHLVQCKYLICSFQEKMYVEVYAKEINHCHGVDRFFWFA